MTEFEHFFETVFKPALSALSRHPSGTVLTGGHTINDASWDRKAAYLLFMLSRGEQPPDIRPEDH